MKALALAALAGAAFFAAPALATGRGVAVVLERAPHRGNAVIEVRNPGNRRGQYTVEVLLPGGERATEVRASPSTFTLGRGRNRRVRISNIPEGSLLCASVEASPTLRLRSCAPRSLR